MVYSLQTPKNAVLACRPQGSYFSESCHFWTHRVSECCVSIGGLRKQGCAVRCKWLQGIVVLMTPCIWPAGVFMACCVVVYFLYSLPNIMLQNRLAT